MRLFVAVTDHDWFQLHAQKSSVDEVNFWQPSPDANFRALAPGEILLFKLHAPNNFIAGGGFFTRFLHLPISLVWDAFGEGNGVRTLPEMRQRIAKYRRVPIGPNDNPAIGCIMLCEPFFFAREEWVPTPTSFSLNIVQGKGYDTRTGEGQALWAAVTERLAAHMSGAVNAGPATAAAAEGAVTANPRSCAPVSARAPFVCS